MLPAPYRMRRSSDFEVAVRRGRRVGRRTVVVHLSSLPTPGGTPTEAPSRGGRLVGFVVSRAVGTAVVRTRVKRRLRGLMAQRLDRLPLDCRVVVRANPSAGGATGALLARDLDSALRQLLTAGAQGSTGRDSGR